MEETVVAGIVTSPIRVSIYYLPGVLTLIIVRKEVDIHRVKCSSKWSSRILFSP